MILMRLEQLKEVNLHYQVEIALLNFQMILPIAVATAMTAAAEVEPVVVATTATQERQENVKVTVKVLTNKQVTTAPLIMVTVKDGIIDMLNLPVMHRLEHMK